jgi:hypothetical protein
VQGAPRPGRAACQHRQHIEGCYAYLGREAAQARRNSRSSLAADSARCGCARQRVQRVHAAGCPPAAAVVASSVLAPAPAAAGGRARAYPDPLPEGISLHSRGGSPPLVQTHAHCEHTWQNSHYACWCVCVDICCYHHCTWSSTEVLDQPATGAVQRGQMMIRPPVASTCSCARLGVAIGPASWCAVAAWAAVNIATPHRQLRGGNKQRTSTEPAPKLLPAVAEAPAERRLAVGALGHAGGLLAPATRWAASCAWR